MDIAKRHPSLTVDHVSEAIKRYHDNLDNPGFCLSCGHEAEGCEPDAEGYECESCGEPTVMGASELLIHII